MKAAIRKLGSKQRLPRRHVAVVVVVVRLDVDTATESLMYANSIEKDRLPRAAR